MRPTAFLDSRAARKLGLQQAVLLPPVPVFPALHMQPHSTPVPERPLVGTREMATADGSQAMEDRSTHQEDEVLSGLGGLEAASCRPCPMVRGSGPQGSSAWTCRVLGSIQCLGPTNSREGHLFCGCPLSPTGLPMGGSTCSLSTHQARRAWPHVPCCWALHSPPEPGSLGGASCPSPLLGLVGTFGPSALLHL